MTVNMKPPLSAQSEVVNTNRRWNQDWYTWLSDFVNTVNISGGGGSSGNLGIINVKSSPFNAIGDGVANDTAAIQAALDSGRGSPITVYFPPGTYNVAPPNVGPAPCLSVRYDNITMLGCGPTQSVIKCFVAGMLDPNTNFTPTNWGVGQSVWRGHGMLIHSRPLFTSGRTHNSAATGKYYFEWTSGSNTSNSWLGVGLSSANFPVQDCQGSNASTFLGGIISYGVWGTVFINSLSPSFDLGTINAGDTVALAVDLTARLAWVKNITQGGNWNANGAANPATGVGGSDISSLQTNVWPTVTLKNGNANPISVTFNMGATAYAGAVPAGFASWPGNDSFNPADYDVTYLTLSNNNLTLTRPVSASNLGRQNIIMRGLRLTGQCLRSTATWPYGGSLPPFQPGLVGPTADGWDISHNGWRVDADVDHDTIQVIECEMDGWKGEIFYGGSDSSTNFLIDRTLLHDTNADVISAKADPFIIRDNIMHDGSAIVENAPYNANLTISGNFCKDFTSGFDITNQTDAGGDADLNGITVICDNVVIGALGNGVFIQNWARQIWVHDNTFVDCGNTQAGVLISAFSDSGNAYKGANYTIEDNIFYAHDHGLIGISVSNAPTSTGAIQMFIRRNKFLVTPEFSGSGAGFNKALRYQLTATDVLYVEDNDFSIPGGNLTGGNIEDLNPGVGTIVFRGNVLALGAPLPERAMLYTQFDKTNNTTLANVGMTNKLGLAGIYTFTSKLYVSANASGGAKVAVSFSGIAHEFYATAKLYTGTTLSASGSTSTNGASIAGATAAVDSIEISGYIVCSKLSAEVGSLDVQFAQNAAFGTASSVLKGSFLSVCESQYQSAY